MRRLSANAHQRWAIFTTDKQKANRIIAQVLEEQDIKGTKVIKAYQNKKRAEIHFEDGNYLIWIGHTDNFKGFRFHRLWCDKDIDQDYFEYVIMPMVHYIKYEDIVWI